MQDALGPDLPAYEPNFYEPKSMADAMRLNSIPDAKRVSSTVTADVCVPAVAITRTPHHDVSVAQLSVESEGQFDPRGLLTPTSSLNLRSRKAYN